EERAGTHSPRRAGVEDQPGRGTGHRARGLGAARATAARRASSGTRRRGSVDGRQAGRPADAGGAPAVDRPRSRRRSRGRGRSSRTAIGRGL
ncbi:MAG: hypothetical protein AVDCRST_MAG69-1822, partial [uncultured Solirubrobacteraceae bacterium]